MPNVIFLLCYWILATSEDSLTFSSLQFCTSKILVLIVTGIVCKSVSLMAQGQNGYQEGVEPAKRESQLLGKGGSSVVEHVWQQKIPDLIPSISVLGFSNEGDVQNKYFKKHCWT